MVKNFECPSCGAPLEYRGSPTTFCSYCQSTVFAPADIGSNQPARAVIDLRPYTRNRSGNIDARTKLIIGAVIIFIVLIFAAPFIIGLVGAILGIIAAAAASL